MDTTIDPNAASKNAGSGDAISAALGGSGSVSDMFVKLLVAQIKNQNPLEPTDPSQFVNQLTQLSQMEALQKLTDQGTGNASLLSSMQMLALGAQVGSQVTVQSDKVTLADQPVPLSFTLTSNSTQTTLVLKGDDGKEKRIELGSHGIGPVNYMLDPAAQGMAAGTYSMSLVTSSKETPALQVTGTLSNVQLAGGAATMNVAGAGPVSPSAITAFNGRPATSTAN